jgi:DNA processing protein
LGALSEDGDSVRVRGMPDDQLPLESPSEDFAERAISPLVELGAYEAMWEEPNASFKRLAEKFAQVPGSVPSDFVPTARATEYGQAVSRQLRESGERFGVRVSGAAEYPKRLRDAAYPVQFLYYRGWWDLVESRSVAVVGTRKPSEEGVLRARRVVKELVRDHFTVVSGLAAGIDTVAHTTAIDTGGRTIAVLGTPLTRVYPVANRELQNRIAREHLVISQVPVRRYERQTPKVNRFFFPERNITMSALTEATVIIEAGETSGTLIQARAALDQGRKLFILRSCFEDRRLNWPRKLADRGAICVTTYDDIRKHLSAAAV